MMPHELTPMNYPTLISFAQDFLVSLSQSADGDLALPTPEELSFMKSQGWLKPNGLSIFSLKTCRGFSITPTGKLGELSSMRFQNSGIVFNMVCLTQRISESHSNESACTLSDILIQDCPEKYFLSEKAVRKLLNNSSQAAKVAESTELTESAPASHPKEVAGEPKQDSTLLT